MMFNVAQINRRPPGRQLNLASLEICLACAGLQFSPVRVGGRSSAAVYTRCCVASLTAYIMSFFDCPVWLGNCMVKHAKAFG
jgi:hypothetical protein